MKRFYLLVTLPALLGACGSRTPRNKPTPPPDNRPIAFVQVENREYSDARVYLLCNSTRTQLGVVDAASKRTFRATPAFKACQGVARFEIQPIMAVGMSEPFVTQNLLLQSGDAVRISLFGAWSTVALVPRESLDE